MLLTVQPVARKHVLVGVNVHSLTLFLARHPLTIVLTLVSIHQSSNTVLEVGLELSSVNITIGVSVLSLTLSLTIDVKSLVNLSIGVGGSGLASVVF